MTATPNKVGDYAHNILSQPWDKTFFKILKLSYEWGIGKIYTEDDIRIAKASQSFEREYNLSFTSSTGNSFSKESIDKAIEHGKKYDPVIFNKEADHSLGVDPGFGPSSFGLVCLEHSDSIIKVVAAEVHERSSFNDMLQRVWEIKNEVGTLNNIYIDAANVEFVEAVKQDLGENSNWRIGPLANRKVEIYSRDIVSTSLVYILGLIQNSILALCENTKRIIRSNLINGHSTCSIYKVMA